MNYEKIAETTRRLVSKNGRPVTLYKVSDVVADPTKPWRGAGEQDLIEPVNTMGAFVIGNTAIPTESRGLAFDWVDAELLKSTRKVCIVAAIDLPDLEEYRMVRDGDSLQIENILWGQCLKPGDVRILYVFGIKE
jgi:hypothetical protein